MKNGRGDRRKGSSPKARTACTWWSVANYQRWNDRKTPRFLNSGRASRFPRTRHRSATRPKVRWPQRRERAEPARLREDRDFSGKRTSTTAGNTTSSRSEERRVG